MEPSRDKDGARDVDEEYLKIAKTVKTLTPSERFVYQQVAERLLTHIENSRKMTDELVKERNAILSMLGHDASIKKLLDSTS